MTSCPDCALPLHAGETCHHALGRALAASSSEIKLLRQELASLTDRPAVAAPPVPWRGTLRG